ncbi:MAG: MerR family transcriptional regulator [Bacteriovorax sp.]|jgi:MerR family mercuric resistance operon transcriptional regulator
MNKKNLELTISQFAKMCDVGIETIRFYHRQQVLSVPGKIGKVRKYGEKEFQELTFIKNAKSCGLSIVEIKTLKNLKCQSDEYCKSIQQIIDLRQSAIKKEIEYLQSLAEKLWDMRSTCHECFQKENCPMMDNLHCNKKIA